MSKQKVKIENAVRDVLDGEQLKNTLDFIAFLRENKMNPANTSKNGWKISSKACVVCYIGLNPDTGDLWINPFIGEYEYNSLSDELKEIALARKKQGSPCSVCHVISGDGYNCSYKLKTIFGKEYADACARSISFINPNADEFECIKKLVVLRKNTIKNGRLLPNPPKNFV
jgi:hypothetical protein